MQIQGVVEQASSRAAGRGTVHSIKVNGEWYGGMWDNPGCQQGDTVTFEATRNDRGYQNVVKGTLQKQMSAPPAAAAPAGQAAGWESPGLAGASRRSASALPPSPYPDEQKT